ncbi:hypothetical protein AN414_22340 [Serratia marcescens]|nr:hypothetical protein AN414_22340 [Serratia marcescens]
MSIIADAINSAHRGEISKVANKLYQNTFGENTRQSARSFFDGLMGDMSSRTLQATNDEMPFGPLGHGRKGRAGEQFFIVATQP